MYKLPNSAARTLTVWDSDLTCTLKPDSLLLWRQFVDQSHDGTVISISEIVEKNGHALRARLLQLIFDIGTSVTENPKTSHKFRNGFEYFWMTQLHSRPYTQSAQLNNLAKIFATYEVLRENRIKQLIVHSIDENLIEVFKSLAESLQIEMQAVSTKAIRRKIAVRTRIKSLVPRPILAILALFAQLKNSITLRSKSLKTVHPDSISIFDYWYRFAESVGSDRKFGSQYWSNLVNHLEDTNVNWWHNLVDQHKVAELRTVRKLLTDFNRNTQHHHEIIDSRISLKILLRTIFDHVMLVLGSIPAKKYKASFIDPATGINYWPLLKREWLNSLRGYEALINCLRFNRLESLVSTMPRQKIGVYLIENQPWEMALVYLWRKHNHGKLIGVAHSTIRFWDLRLMSDTKRFEPTSEMPRPDCIAVNGKLAKSSLLETGYPAAEIVEVEALMYLQLAAKKIEANPHAVVTILVATDYLDSATQAQMRLLEELVATNPGKYRLLLKPHWSQSLKNLSVDAEFVSGKKELSQFFNQVDVLYCSSITSAVIDGVCAGLPVIQCLDPMSFNLSPLRDSAALQTVRTSTELATALEQINKFTPLVNPDELFNLDPSLPKWKNLLQT